MNSKGSFIRTHFPFYELALKLENNFIFYEVPGSSDQRPVLVPHTVLPWRPGHHQALDTVLASVLVTNIATECTYLSYLSCK